MTSPSVDFYNNAYGHHASDVVAAVRRETYGEDIGQSSWLTVDEYRRFWEWLGINAKSHVLEIGCGSGGPTIFMATAMGCRVHGIDVNEHGVGVARQLAATRGLGGRARFEQADASKTLSLENGDFDAAICIDAIIHIPNRVRLLADLRRVLRIGGRLLYTDPTVVTGLVSKEELAIRGSIGSFEFSAIGANERLIESAGLTLLRCDDATENTAMISRRWHDARAARRDDLIRLEGADTFDGTQRFLDVVHRLSSERRLSRLVFLAERLA
jgi:cyclopropane fatty-acyl-phospholipid synthase-like methyltransferase